MHVLFLTNNDIVYPLYQWLISNGEHVIYSGKRISVYDVEEQNIEFVISYNYRYIINSDIIAKLPARIINMHISYLPWNRGASPNIFSFLEGTPAGISIHEVSLGLDKGDILAQEQLTFDYDTETLRSSYERSHKAIQNLFCLNWEKIKSGKLCPQKQVGEGSYHRSQELDPYKEILDYNDSISSFLRKAQPIYKQLHNGIICPQ